jgi:anti-sigma factor RsiW
MSAAVCEILRGSLDEYLREELPAPQRNMLREHLGACDECRAAAAGKDATFLFARPMPEIVSPAETAGILSAVRTGVSLMQAERRLGGGTRRRIAGVAAAAVVALLVLAIPGGDERPAAGVAALSTPSADASATTMTGTRVAASGGDLAAVTLPADSGAPSPGATMYDLNPGAGRGEPRVVWIVDGGLDI